MAQDTTVKKAEAGQKKAAKTKATKAAKPKAPKAAKPAAPKAPKAVKAPKAPKAVKAPKAAKPAAPKAAKPAGKLVEVPANLKAMPVKAVAMGATKALKKSAATAPAKAYVDELVRRLNAAEVGAKSVQKKLDSIKKLV